MYIPHQYRQEDPKRVKEFIREHSFGILVNQVNNKPVATHLPMELEEMAHGQLQLVGHIAKANPQWHAFKEPQQVLCIFNGPHAYVSSSWYREEEVPTWDYMAVHVYGSLEVLGQDALYASLERLVTRYEKQSKEPVSLSGMSVKTLRQIHGIVGFKVAVDDVQAAYKLSQGRPGDHARIIQELEARGDAGSRAVAEAIKKQEEPGSK